MSEPASALNSALPQSSKSKEADQWKAQNHNGTSCSQEVQTCSSLDGNLKSNREVAEEQYKSDMKDHAANGIPGTYVDDDGRMTQALLEFMTPPQGVTFKLSCTLQYNPVIHLLVGVWGATTAEAIRSMPDLGLPWVVVEQVPEQPVLLQSKQGGDESIPPKPVRRASKGTKDPTLNSKMDEKRPGAIVPPPAHPEERLQLHLASVLQPSAVDTTTTVGGYFREEKRNGLAVLTTFHGSLGVTTTEIQRAEQNLFLAAQRRHGPTIAEASNAVDKAKDRLFERLRDASFVKSLPREQVTGKVYHFSHPKPWNVDYVCGLFRSEHFQDTAVFSVSSPPPVHPVPPRLLLEFYLAANPSPANSVRSVSSASPVLPSSPTSANLSGSGSSTGGGESSVGTTVNSATLAKVSEGLTKMAIADISTGSGMSSPSSSGTPVSQNRTIAVSPTISLRSSSSTLPALPILFPNAEVYKKLLLSCARRLRQNVPVNVAMFGSESGCLSGVLTAVDLLFDRRFTACALAKYTQESVAGDSGALVFTCFESQLMILGVHQGIIRGPIPARDRALVERPYFSESQPGWGSNLADYRFEGFVLRPQDSLITGSP